MSRKYRNPHNKKTRHTPMSPNTDPKRIRFYMFFEGSIADPRRTWKSDKIHYPARDIETAIKYYLLIKQRNKRFYDIDPAKTHLFLREIWEFDMSICSGNTYRQFRCVRKYHIAEAFARAGIDVTL